ncbi:hypothetical protein J4G07_20290 [Candidatus Poribacteria bacterium]|nr:hypothetical protein [Candidatus Poribacteria bacterium]
MKNKLMIINFRSYYVCLLIVLAFDLSNSFAQYDAYTQFSLPEGAKVRFGKGLIGDLVYSPDGTVLTVSGPTGIWLYDAANSEELALLTDHTDGVDDLVFRHDGLTLVSASHDGDVYLWDPATGASHQIPMEDTDDVSGVSFSLDGSILAGRINPSPYEHLEEQHRLNSLDLDKRLEKRLDEEPLDLDVMSDVFNERREKSIQDLENLMESLMYPDYRTVDCVIRLWDVMTYRLCRRGFV